MQKYNIKDFENQKNIRCLRCKYTFGKKLFDGGDTKKEFGGCPRCYYKMLDEGFEHNKILIINKRESWG